MRTRALAVWLRRGSIGESKPFGRAVLFGLGSPIVSDFEDALSSRGVRKLYGVQNDSSDPWVSSEVKTFSSLDVPMFLRQLPTFIPITRPENRRSAFGNATDQGFNIFPPLIHPSSDVAKSTRCLDGVFIGSGVTIGSESRLLEHSFVNRGVSLGHHNVVGSFAFIGPGVVSGGFVVFEPGCMVGLGARILPGVSIGENAIVGAGSLVTKDVPSNTTVAGLPARKI